MKKQLHKYHRIEVAGAKVWACALSDCTHYMPKHMEQIVLGKKSICWSCDAQFSLDEEAMQEDKPRCWQCRHPKEMSDEDKFLLDYVNSLPEEQK